MVSVVRWTCKINEKYFQKAASTILIDVVVLIFAHYLFYLKEELVTEKSRESKELFPFMNYLNDYCTVVILFLQEFMIFLVSYKYKINLYFLSLFLMQTDWELNLPEGLNCEESRKIERMCINPKCSEVSLTCSEVECQACKSDQHISCQNVKLKGVTY